MAHTRPTIVRRSTNRTARGPAARRLSGNLSNGVIVVLSGGVKEDTNPIDVRQRMDQIIADVNNDRYVKKHTDGKGLRFLLLKNQNPKKPHIHQSRWKHLCRRLQELGASPLIIVGHSSGGAAAMSLARCVHRAGIFVDLPFSCDSVFTTKDLGDPNEVPDVVLLNINSYVVPTKHFWTLPFPIGRRNRREGKGHPFAGIINIGLEYALGGGIAHKNAFYELAGGRKTKLGYTRPHLVLDTILAVLKGQPFESILTATRRSLRRLSTLSGIPIDLDTQNVQETIRPAV
jgi:hypothetical protein